MALNVYDLKTKSVELYILLVPRPEALALPDIVERAMQNHADVYNTPIMLIANKGYQQLMASTYTHNMASTIAMFLTISETCEISERQVQTLCKRLFYI